MNNRYQDLAREAGLLVHNPERMPTKLQKFAELLIQECITKIENEAMQSFEPIWTFELVNDIKEHFGLTETRSQKMKNAGFTRRPKGWLKEEL
jgi:hypothetical protein